MAAHQRETTGGVPAVAVLLTWFVPGAGHLYLGLPVVAAVAFVVVEGLYLLGLTLSQGMFLEYLPEELRSAFAGALSPEFGNLGGLLYHMREYGYGPGFMRAWPPHMDLGTTLTSFSGILNCILMSHAHLAARAPQAGRVFVAGSSPTRTLAAPFAALATWAVPGLGQFLQGRRLRGAAMFAALASLFVVGTLLAQGSNLDRERHFYYWGGQFLIGLPSIVAEFIHGHPRVQSEIPYAEAGVVLGCVAGMLNILCMLDAYGFSEDLQLGRNPRPESGVSGSHAAEAKS